ncbi:UNVERIFIED_ORG: DNA polymerase III alpha subunit (gram-positive type) [Methylobacterium sp. SuP10 SLI 274]|uniref:hypothetical protein n=1 Tax=Methylorubrum extorquens TaxID=408 RepID=UPI00209F439D|nr:hypothetical protein [Methylorubrum extorquens]MDF9864155.1 DNA polymerase III alpha subunit (gram-positive type) [Methylorubrum pseudosasae]MDH6637748.1 DNA polymerase III alpha subunit (gram-positive type) [Methylobacterium sp. SuP10 SLI 274]MDH6666927.1 DNA polymerase III alpha subunit (gram-positive type) [Methylorubrum zatmanii]MCP1558833.1 DNA polymerase III alpha subunit (gram-positive type) [Methylorubrum extorquens]MDF9792467.1 DNA polymerase III alpha subunit (gram-positive type) 
MPEKGKQAKATFMTEAELFDALTKSAFEFLHRSIDEFEKSHKFSTIHFAIAIELFLKAKLMREHWSLLLEKPDHAERASFFSGDAKTVTIEQTIERLRRIASVTIPQNSKDIFGTIIRHRNKMVHFAHVVENDDEDEEGKAKLAEEQCAGWLALRTLLAQWQEFEKFSNDVAHISFKMERYQVYLKKVFESRAQDIQKHINSGNKISKCRSCGFEAVEVSDPIGAIAYAKCLVCRYNGSEITVACQNEDCGESICFTSYDGPPDKCPKCEENLTKDEVRDFLDTGEGIHKDNYFDHVPVNCPQCSGYHTVIEHESIYVCSECYETDDSYEVCGYCSEGQLGGVPEHSYLVGCEFCEGAAERYRDD